MSIIILKTMEQILCRIRIRKANSKEILYTTDLSVLKEFGLLHDSEFENLRILKKGTEFQYDHVNYRIIDLYTYFYDELEDNDSDKGTDLFGDGQRFPFNFDITYYVEEVSHRKII